MGLFGPKLSQWEKEEKKAMKKLNKLKDSEQAAFYSAVLTAGSLPVNRAALARLTDPMLLAEVAIRSSHQVRLEALKKLHDQKALVYAAKKMKLAGDYHTAQNERLALFHKIETNNYVMVKEIYAHAADDGIKRYAEECVAAASTDEDELVAIATSSQNLAARTTAINRIADQDKLYELAKRGHVDAVRRLTYSERLTEVFKTSEDHKVLAAVLNNPHFADQELLAETAVKNGDYSMRQWAYRNPNLKDPVLLAYVFRECEDTCHRDLDITDVELLTGIARNAKDFYNPKKALHKIPGWEDLPWATELNEVLSAKEAADAEDSRLAALYAADSY